MTKTNKIIALSGGFDPVHYGHLQMIEDAAKLGRVLIILNSDEWLIRKKGYAFMPWKERRAILMAMTIVEGVIVVDDSDDTVCEAIKRVRPEIFGNGGDRTDTNTPETYMCKLHNIEMVWGLGGEKVQSSSDLVDKLNKQKGM